MHTICEEFSSNMKKLNDEQIFTIEDIIFVQTKYPIKPLHIFLTRGECT
jgi:hypothetical protein